MNLTDNETLKFQCGVPVFLDDVCAIYPATLREIVEIGYDTFQKYLAILALGKPTNIDDKGDKELNELFSKLTDLQYLISLTLFDASAGMLLKNAFHFFIHEDVIFLMEPAQIIVGDINDKHIIDEHNFPDFQRILKHMYFLEQDGSEIIINDDDSPIVRRMKLKMIENRKKLKKAKAAKNRGAGSEDIKFSDLIGSLPLNDCNLNLVNIWDLTYYALQDQLKRMGWRDQFKLNHEAALAGAKIKKEDLKHWIRNIANTD